MGRACGTQGEKYKSMWVLGGNVLSRETTLKSPVWDFQGSQKVVLSQRYRRTLSLISSH